MHRVAETALQRLVALPVLAVELSGADPGWQAVLGCTQVALSSLLLGGLQSLQMPHVENWMPLQSSHAVRLAVGPLPRGQALQP